jgi:O-antigen ligase
MSAVNDKGRLGVPAGGRFVSGRPPIARFVAARRAGKNAEGRSAHSLAFAGLFLFTLLLYARPNELLPEIFGSFPITRIVGYGALITYIISKLRHSERLTIWPLELKMLAVIVLLGVAFLPIAAIPDDTIHVLQDTFLKVVCIFVLMINIIRTRERLRLMLRLVVLCGAVLSIFAINSYISGDFATRGIRIAGAVGGMFGNPNDLATSFDLLLPLAVTLAFMAKGVGRAIYLTCALLLSIGVVVTFSRSGFLGFLAVGAVLLWKLGRSNRMLAAVAFLAIIAFFAFAAPGGYGQRITSIFNIQSDPTGSAQMRRDHLDRALRVALLHPFIGVGMGNYHIYSLQEQRAHNSYLEISAELGVAGLIAYLILIFAPLRALRRIERQSRGSIDSSPRFNLARSTLEDDGANLVRQTYYMSVGLQAAIIGYIVCSFFSSIQYQWYLYYLIGYGVLLRLIHSGEESALTAQEPPEAPEPRAKGVLWKTGSRATDSAIERPVPPADR